MDSNSQARSAGGVRTRSSASDELSPTASGRRATVLVVDDEQDLRQSTAAILRAEGFHVLEAADGTAATWLLASEDIDVLLLDLHLRRQDGTAVLEALEESSTVVVFSAFEYFDESDIRRKFGPVLFDCLRKPVPPPRLVGVIAAAAVHAQNQGHEPKVRPIGPRMALGLAMAGLSRMTPEAEAGS
jgi:two-component system, OmpR family, response regulator